MLVILVLIFVSVCVLYQIWCKKTHLHLGLDMLSVFSSAASLTAMFAVSATMESRLCISNNGGFVRILHPQPLNWCQYKILQV